MPSMQIFIRQDLFLNIHMNSTVQHWYEIIVQQLHVTVTPFEVSQRCNVLPNHEVTILFLGDAVDVIRLVVQCDPKHCELWQARSRQ